jgi:hypothetical protein
MQPLSEIKADGSRRDPRSIHGKPKRCRSRRANGKSPRGVDRRSSEARRLGELIEAFGAGIEQIDEPVLAVIRGAALMAQQLERLEEKVTRGETIDEMRLQRLSNSLTRALVALNHLKATPKNESAAGMLAGHLAAIAARRAERERLADEAEAG